MSYDQWLAALMLWREARGASLSAMTGIYWVLLNRVRDSLNRWPKSIPAVILQHAQFSSFNAGDPNAVKFPIPPLGASVMPSADWTAWLNAQAVVQTSLGADPTMGATNYHSEPENPPAWADPAKLTVTIGAFRFYKL